MILISCISCINRLQFVVKASETFGFRLHFVVDLCWNRQFSLPAHPITACQMLRALRTSARSGRLASVSRRATQSRFATSKAAAAPVFQYQDLFETSGALNVPYKKLTSDHVRRLATHILSCYSGFDVQCERTNCAEGGTGGAPAAECDGDALHCALAATGSFAAGNHVLRQQQL